MIDQSKVEKYLDDLAQQVSDLRNLPIPNKEFLTKKENFERIKAVKHSLLLAIEDVIHIASHLVAALGLGRPHLARSSELLEILGKNKIIPEKFAEEIKGMTSFRNKLVHEYLPDQFDATRLYENLQKLDDFKKFSQYIVKFLER